MKKNFLIFIGMLTFLCGCFSSTKIDPGDTVLFIKFIGGARDDIAYAMEASNDGGFVLTGGSDSYGTRRQLFVTKTNVLGNKQWEKSFGNNTLIQEGRDVAVLSNGNTLVLGYTSKLQEFIQNTGRLLLIELDTNGELVEADTLGSTPIKTNGNFYLNSSADGGFLLIANIPDSGGDNTSDMQLIKLDSNKDIVYERSYGLISKDDDLGSIIEADNGDIVWCGTSWRQGSSSDMRVIRSDAFGNLKWDFAFGENNGLSEKGMDIQKIPGGGFIVVGSATDNGNTDAFLVKIDENGNPQWVNGADTGKKIGGDGNQSGVSVSITSDDGFIVTGTTEVNNTNSNIYLFKTDSDGNLLWQNSFGSQGLDQGKIVRQSTQDGGYLLLGTIRFNNNYVMGLIKTSAMGKTL